MTTDILIVDDDSDLSQITSDILQEYGYQTKCCISAEEAYDFLKANTPLLIILDINLPGEDGYAFCQSLRRESEIPIIFISARSSESFQQISNHRVNKNVKRSILVKTF